jgi:hypothetical protein
VEKGVKKWEVGLRNKENGVKKLEEGLKKREMV